MPSHLTCHRVVLALFVLLLSSTMLASSGLAAPRADDEFRQWSDATGRFKVAAKLVEVADGNVVLENKEGKTLRIPLARLSQADQQFLAEGDNPFEMVDESGTAPGTGTAPSAPASGGSAGRGSGSSASIGGSGWNASKKVDFDGVDEVSTVAGVDWSVTPPASGELGFEAKRTPLPKKTNFHEGLHPLVVNAAAQRAVVGFTASFSLPEPLSRISLLDLVSGKAVHSEQVEANMRPLALLNGGAAVLMVGSGDERDGYETPDQVQVWRLQGKTVVRTPSWIPYPNDKEDWGKRANAQVVAASPINEKAVVTVSDKGHLVVWDILEREPLWHLRLSDRNFGMDLSMDRQLLAVADDKVLMVLNAATGEILGSSAVPEPAQMGWCRVCWSPSGKRILFTSVGDIRVLNVETGEWEVNFHLADAPIATNTLSYPHEDFALLNNSLLVHLPTKIQVCEYQSAQQIVTLGGTSFIGLQDQAGGIIVPAQFPHPTAASLLETAQKDPSVFLIHPGVGVAIDVAAAGQHSAQVKQNLETAAKNSGYKLDPASPIKLVGSVSGPKQEAVSYIGRGSHVVNSYISTVKIVWSGQDLWTTSGTNVPGMLMTSSGETIEQALAKAGEQPNLTLFERVKFPEFVQRPSGNAQPGVRPTAALMTAKFTLQGLVDSK